MIKVSIITTVFNAGDVLEKTIRSVLEQTYPHIEYIIIDGGSTNGTIEIIKKHQHHLAYWISEPDRGVYDGMNKGIQLATGNIIGLLNAGDWYEPNTAKIVASEVKKHPQVDIFYGDRNYIIGGKKVYKPSLPLEKTNDFWLEPSLPHPAFFVTKRLYNELPYDPQFKIVADYKFTLQALKLGKKTQHIPAILNNVTAGGLSSSYGKSPWQGYQVKLNMLNARLKARRQVGFPSSIRSYLLFLRDHLIALLSLTKRLWSKIVNHDQ